MLNEIVLQGRLTKAPELKTTTSGKSVCSFSLAVERDFSTDGEKITDFINIVTWGKTAEFVSRYFAKGKQMIVKGSLQVRKYQTQNGENRETVEVVAEKVYFAGDKAEQTSTPYPTEQPAVNQNSGGFEEITYTDEMLPF